MGPWINEYWARVDMSYTCGLKEGILYMDFLKNRWMLKSYKISFISNTYGDIRSNKLIECIINQNVRYPKLVLFQYIRK